MGCGGNACTIGVGCGRLRRSSFFACSRENASVADGLTNDMACNPVAGYVQSDWEFGM